MVEFRLSEHVNTSNVFLIRFSEIKERLDVSAYKKAFAFESKVYPVFRLSEIVFLNPSTNFSKLNKDTEISFVPMEAVDDIDGRIIEYQTKKVVDTKGFTRFLEGDLIWAKITPCMQNGKSAVVRNTINGYACGSTEFFILRPKSSNVLIEYIHFILRDKRILNSAQNFFGGSAGQQRVSRVFLEELSIPLPPLEVQYSIVDILEIASFQKQQKEAEAQALLDSIDGFLLKELGITLPEQDNSLEKRIFRVGYSNIDERLDPIYYNSDLSLFRTGRYNLSSIKDVAYSLKSGIGAGKQDQALDENGIIQIRPTNVDNNGNLKFDRNVYLPYSSVSINDLLKVGDVLFNNTNSQDLVGKTALLKEELKLSFSNHITRIRVKSDKVLPDYLEVLLNSYQKHKIFYSICTNWNNQSGVGIELLRSLTIPLPPLEKQQEIANHIQSIRNKAKQLQEEAKAILENAKQEVEKMILGE